MAQLPRRRAPDLKALAAALACALAPGAARAGVDLVGTWHVLVHYRDSSTAHPEAEHWEDRVWDFEASGSRLRWSEFPIVVFDDEGGRFEREDGTGQYARVLHFWEPSAAQLANIRGGLSVNERGSRTKTLREQQGAWSTAERASAAGASAITYQELWSIDDPEGLPAFVQVDVLASAGAESLEGRTELRTEQVLDGGDRLVGRFQRDGTRSGTFEMRRSGAHKALRQKSQSELHAQASQRGAASSKAYRLVVEPLRRDLAKDGIEVDEIEAGRLMREAQDRLDEGKSADEVRRGLEESVRAARAQKETQGAP